MAKITVRTSGTGSRDDMRREMKNRVVKATAVLHEAVVRKVSTPGPPRSRPGQAPHVETARLRQSIQPEVTTGGDDIRGSVGTNLEYAPHLEYGTSRMAARPFLRSTLAEQESRLAILKGEKV